jgi:CRP/FNR family transcriptional regulator
MALLTASQQEISFWIEKLYPQFEPELCKSIIEHGIIQHVKAGQTLIRSEHTIKSTMLLSEGLVKVFRNDNDNGDEFFLYYIEPGQVFALSMIYGSQNETIKISKVAATDCVFISLPLTLTETYQKEYSSWNTFMMDNYKRRFQDILEAVSDLAFGTMDERVKHYLEHQTKSLKTNHIHITHEQIAHDLNTSRVVISRILKHMEEAGKLKLHRNSIEIATA